MMGGQRAILFFSSANIKCQYINNTCECKFSLKKCNKNREKKDGGRKRGGSEERGRKREKERKI